jgi:hypothetical protein
MKKTIVQANPGFSVLAAHRMVDFAEDEPEAWFVADYPVVAWEIDGEEREPITIEGPPLGAYATAIVYNGRVLSPETFDNVEDWLSDLKACFKLEEEREAKAKVAAAAHEQPLGGATRA